MSPAPQRPSPWEERLAGRLFLALSPTLPRRAPHAPPRPLLPALNLTVPRPGGSGPLAATWYPAPEPARGAVLLLHPWVQWGKTYFYRGGRIEALRAAGYHALTLDLSGFGDSGPPTGLFDRDVEAGLAFLKARSGDLPLHVWGVSSGGYWAHSVLSRTDGVAGALFEDVSPHLLECSWRMVPKKRPSYLLLRCLFPRVYRFLDLRRHAPALGVAAVAYVSGEKDPGVRPEDTRELARLAGGSCLIVPGAGHLAVIKVAAAEVRALALATFAAAEKGDEAEPARGVS